MNSPKLFCNLESLSFRQIAFGKFFKSAEMVRSKQITFMKIENSLQSKDLFKIQRILSNQENILSRDTCTSSRTLLRHSALCHTRLH